MTKNVIIAGATGSIGIQALNVCKMHNINIDAISANTSAESLIKITKEFNIKKIHINDEEKYFVLKNNVSKDVKIYVGREGIFDLIKESDADTFLNGISGFLGLEPTLKAIDKKMKIALANKETIVCGGELVMKKAKEANVEIMPVDSEHSAVFQCLKGNNEKEVKRIILTASGGPFFNRKDLSGITLSDALKHPNWSMGKKITIDSATLMNKALEVVEAYHLFNHKKIDVIIHRESIIHSMVEYNDNAILAQLGTPDMTIPIQLALTYPNRYVSSAKAVDFSTLSSLTFYPPDRKVFKALDIADYVLKNGGTSPCIMNAANEVAVEAFIKGKLAFNKIAEVTFETVKTLNPIKDYTLEDVLKCDSSARKEAHKIINRITEE